MSHNTHADYWVTVVLDHGHLSTLVSVPSRPDDDPAYDDDDSAINLAVAVWRDHYGFDVSRVRWCDVTVELQG